jgi:hypothetical protein
MNLAADIYAFVAIPYGYKATHVQIYGRDMGISIPVTVYRASISSATWNTITGGSGVVNTEITFTSAVNWSSTGYLLIKVNMTNTNHRIYGGYVTISPI